MYGITIARLDLLLEELEKRTRIKLKGAFHDTNVLNDHVTVHTSRINT